MPPQQSTLSIVVDNGASYVGYVATDGTAYAGSTPSDLGSVTWYREFDGAQSISFALDPWFRIGVLDSGGTFQVKQGGLLKDWVAEANSISQGLLCLASYDFQGGGYGRLGVIDTEGRFNVKEGDLNASWTLEANGAAFGVIDEARIGFVDVNGILNVKEGSLDADWTTEANGILQFALDGSNIGEELIGIVDNTNLFSLKVGPLAAKWVAQPFTNVQQISLAEGRIGVLTADGTFSVADYTLNYAVVANDAAYIAVSGRLAAYVRRGDQAILAQLEGVQGWTQLSNMTGPPPNLVTGRSLLDAHGQQEPRRRRSR
jgi:hypothetical protein